MVQKTGIVWSNSFVDNAVHIDIEENLEEYFDSGIFV